MTSPRATASATTNSSARALRGIPARRRGPDLRISFERLLSASCVASGVASGVASCRLPNRAHYRPSGLGEREEINFLESTAGKFLLCSGASASKFGAATSQTSRLLRGLAAQSARPIFTSKARRRRLTRRLWQCSTNYGPASGLEIFGGLYRRAAGEGVIPSADHSSEIEPDERLQITSRSNDCEGGGGGKAGRCDEILSSGSERCERNVFAEGSRQVLESQAKATEGKTASTGNATMGPASEGLRVGEPARTGRLSWPALGRTSNVSELGVTGGESAAQIFSSGDGLGIHQPGSMTRGFAFRRQPASGRARQRAMCPAVARFNQGRAA